MNTTRLGNFRSSVGVNGVSYDKRICHVQIAHIYSRDSIKSSDWGLKGAISCHFYWLKANSSGKLNRSAVQGPETFGDILEMLAKARDIQSWNISKWDALEFNNLSTNINIVFPWLM